MDPNRVRLFLKDISKNLNRLSYADVCNLCNQNLPAIPIPVIDFTNEKFFFKQIHAGGSNLVFRARQIKNSENSPHKTISDISYIPIDKVDLIKEFGRANKPKESMFYCSLDYATACTEAICKGNVFKDQDSIMLTVGVWKFESPMKLAQIPYSEKYFQELWELHGIESNSIKLENIRELNLKMKDELKSDINFEIMKFFADEFAKIDTKNNLEYQLSNYYTDRVLNRINQFQIDEDFDGILYPSVSLSFQRKNIVLKPSVVETKLKFLYAMQVWMVSYQKKGGGAQWAPIKQNIVANENGELLWQGRR